MYDTETRTRFIELRGQGWSIKRIADRLKVAPRTLVEWNRQDNDQIRTLRVLGLEASRSSTDLGAGTASRPETKLHHFCIVFASTKAPPPNHVFTFHIIT